MWPVFMMRLYPCGPANCAAIVHTQQCTILHRIWHVTPSCAHESELELSGCPARSLAVSVHALRCHTLLLLLHQLSCGCPLF